MTTCLQCHYFTGGPEDRDVLCSEESIPRLLTGADEAACEMFVPLGNVKTKPVAAPPPRKPDERQETRDLLGRLNEEHGRTYRDWHEG